MTDMTEELKQIDAEHDASLEACETIHEQYLQALNREEQLYRQRLVSVGHHYLKNNDLIPEDKDDLKELVKMFTGAEGDQAELIAARDKAAKDEKECTELAAQKRNILSSESVPGAIGVPLLLGGLISQASPSWAKPYIGGAAVVVAVISVGGLCYTAYKGKKEAVKLDKQALAHRSRKDKMGMDAKIYPLAEAITRAFVQNDPTLMDMYPSDGMDSTNNPHVLTPTGLLKSMLMTVSVPAVS